ncbi:MAG: hypothetical protein KBS99_09150 [Prevotellaceae bacterium]|nr:hypothetical protein [Candidatus Colivivens caballi]
MNKIITYLLLQFGFLMLHAQVTVDATIDSTQIFIGEQTGITLQVSADAGKSVVFPKYDSLAQIVPGIEVVSALPVDTERVNDGKRMVLTQKLIVTSFDSALYYLPPMKVKVDGKEYQSKNLALKVYTVDVDTLHTDSICGMKAELAPPFTWDDWKPVIWLTLLFLLIVSALIYVSIRLAKNKPILRHIHLRQRIAPHKLAMQKIEQIREDKLVQSEDSKEYYTQLTETLRQYISERFSFNAMEMTSTEIIEHLQRDNDKEAIDELRELFQTADLVKFAKYTTLINENDRNLLTAVEYINKTKIEEESKPQPKEIVVEEKRSKMAKAVLIGVIALLAVANLGVIIYLIYRLYYLCI